MLTLDEVIDQATEVKDTVKDQVLEQIEHIEARIHPRPSHTRRNVLIGCVVVAGAVAIGVIAYQRLSRYQAVGSETDEALTTGVSDENVVDVTEPVARHSALH